MIVIKSVFRSEQNVQTMCKLKLMKSNDISLFKMTLFGYANGKSK